MRMHNPPHRGKIIKALCLDPLGLTVTEAAKGPGVSRKTLSGILNGRAGISPGMAVRLPVGRGLHAPHRPARALALPALRQGSVRVHSANRACAAALAASAGTAVKDRMRFRFVRRAPGGGPRQACARPFGPVRAIHAVTRACSRTSLLFFSVANACVPLIARPHRHARRLTPAPARLQSL